MKIRRQILCIFSIGILTTMLFAPITAVSLPSQDPTEITFWYTENDTEKPGITDLINQFEALNPDIDVTATQKGFFNARNDYQSAYIAREEPEVFRATRDWVPEFANAKMLKAITSELTQDDLNDFLPIALKMSSYPDPDTGIEEYWSFPQLVDTPALMYNKHHFELAGINTTELSIETSWTWEEYWNILATVNSTADGIYATTLAGMFFGAQPFYFGHGGNLFTNDSVKFETIAINTTEARDGFMFVKNLTDSLYTPRWEEQGWSTINIYFSDEGTVAMVSQGPWELKNFLDNSPEFNPEAPEAKVYASPDNLGIVQLPHDSEGNTGAPVGGQAYVISKNVEGAKYNASVKLCKFLTSEDVMAEKSKSFYHVPARMSVMNRVDVINSEAYPYVKGYYDAVLAAAVVPVDHRWAQVEQRLSDRLDEYLAGDLNLDEFVSAVYANWRIIIPPEGVGGEEPEANIPGYSLSFLLISMSIGIIFLIKKNNLINIK
jgi:ABC-type glycerol-3-phosphate transport system substrate-binding protein